ncbi:MAG: CpsD/CapB family tyrosine-protein kinase [Deferrisomatales bacterium]
MSKIMQVLEKARSEGVLTQSVRVSDERDTQAPLDAGGSQPAPRAPGAHRARKPREIPASGLLDPAVLRGVDLHLDTLHRPLSVASEQYRSLRNRVERLNAEGNLRAIGLTSAGKGEGKSLTSTNLAAVMAQDPTKRVLLVDADFRRPSLHRLLGVSVSPGLADLLEGKAAEDDVVRPTPFFGLHLVTAGEARGHPAELAASPALSEFIARARDHFDYVFVDTPPLHPMSDMSFLSECLDGVIVVVMANKTNRSLLRQVAEILPPHKLLGTVFNRVDQLSGLGYGYGYGYGYGKAGY